MSAEIFELPDTMHRQWRAFEREVSLAMAQRGHAPDVVSHVMTSIKPLYLKYAEPCQLSTGTDIEDALQKLSDWVLQMGSGLLSEVMTREIELYQAGLR